MTVDALWDEILKSLNDTSQPSGAAGRHLRRLIETRDGQAKFCGAIKGKLKKQKFQVLRLFALVVDPREQNDVKLSPEGRRVLLEAAVDAAAVYAEEDALFWRLRWLQLAGRQAQIAPKLAQELSKFGTGSKTPSELVKRLAGLPGWADFPKDRWVELIEKASEAVPPSEFRSRLHQVSELLRDGGRVSQPDPDASPSTSVVPGPVQSEPAGSPATESPRVVIASPPAASPEGLRGEVASPTTESKPASEVPVRGDPPSAPTATIAVGPDPGELPPRSSSATEPIAPPAGDEIVATGVDASAAAASGVREDTTEPKEPRPKRAAKKAAGKGAAKPDGSTTSDGPEPVKLPAAEQTPTTAGGELPAMLTELASAVVSAISGRLDQIASRTSDGATLEQRLVELERRLAGVERALTETQTDAQRSRGEVERLRALIREREQELEDAIRERDAVAARQDDLVRRLASADARINAAESRADQNIHEAFRERDAAVLTFKARLWDLVQAQLSDVTDPIPGEEFASIEEEVLTTRLRSIRDTLRAEGVPP